MSNHLKVHCMATTPVPLAQETRLNIPTADAAHHLGRTPYTLRMWACKNKGPIKPLNVGGRLAWPVADLKRLLGVEVQS